ncbi:MAG: histidine phosphatase family protein [Pseudomonadota bacterium]
MKRLILLRHAKTEPWFEGVDDHGRALTERGRADSERVAKALRDAGWVPDLAVVSTARRAHETWTGAAPAFTGCEREMSDDLYLASVRMIGSLVRAHEDAAALMLIGHNPGIHDFACDLVQSGGAHNRFAAEALINKMPTGAAALFESDEDAAFGPYAFKLMDFIRPKDLRPPE